jgi:hypothetical protein
MPPVRIRVHGRHPSTTATIAAAPRPPAERRRLAAAQATSATVSVGMARRTLKYPIAPPEIDGWTRYLSGNSAAIMRTRAPTRSYQRARLNNNHHRMTSSAPATAPIIP